MSTAKQQMQMLLGFEPLARDLATRKDPPNPKALSLKLDA
jgi:hypothetical protein